MKFVRSHWYHAAIVLAAGVLLWQVLFAHYAGVQLISLLNFVAILIHQFEEYRWPGGESWILNNVSQPGKGGPADRYPLNQANATFMNLAVWPFHIAPIIRPDLIWLGLAPILMESVGQFIVHGIQTNRRLKTWYNPGLGAVVLGHIPLAIWYVIEVYRQDLIAWWDWPVAIVYAVIFLGITFGLIGYRLMVDKNSPHPFTSGEMHRFGREERLRHAGITPLPFDDTP